MRDVNMIIEEFFNLEAPCPSEIHMCDKLRLAYKEELDKVTALHGCSACAKNNVKSKFMETLWKEAITSITQQGS